MMKRIFAVLAVTALMVAMLMASALPAFADPTSTTPNCAEGQLTAALNVNDFKNWENFLRHLDYFLECNSGDPPGLP
jgi:hypothetical protein